MKNLIQIVNMSDAPVVALRVILFLGLVLHKLVWETQKRRGAGSCSEQRDKGKRNIRFIKLLKLLVLLLILTQTLFLNVLPISGNPLLIRIVGCLIYALGLGTAITGRMNLGTNWADLEDFTILQDQTLVIHGIYRHIRHPIYTGDVLLLLGLELALNSWLVLGVPLLFLIVLKQSLAEEAILKDAFPGYSDYCRRSKRFIPFLF